MWLSLFLAIAALLAAWVWHATLRAREYANRIAAETCRKLNVQFLDGTVAFTRMRPARDVTGRLALRRSYVFDYTEDGLTRRQGFVILRGGDLEAVGLAPDTHQVH
ncbi:MAG TPA: DUF3301 domain-containing protein [Steroidobacteraceae bacterium]